MEDAMPAITSLTIAAGRPAVRALIALVRKIKQVGRALKNRHHAATLARLDDHMLADIGLTRSDLRDAYSGSPWQDPTDTLTRRARERRMSRRRAAFENSAGQLGQRSADRRACYRV
jgi:uncharacterized protein YjiS (DUF1127 family)